MLALAGCSSNKASKISSNNVAQISSNVESTIKKVSKIYGEQNPQITKIYTTQEEITKKPMYIVFLKGNFQNGTQKSQKLEFSITEDGKKVWALTSNSWQESQVNITN
jgi:hypothetical protein